MTSKKISLAIIFVFLSLFLSACGASTLSTGWHGLTADTDTAYLAAGTQVYAIDIKSGSQKWNYPDKPNARISFYANPVLTSDGQLLLPSYDTSLYSINPVTKSENWVFPNSTNTLIGSPLVLNDTIYQPSTDYSVYALDLQGKLLWKVATEGPVWATPATDSKCGCIFVASMDHTVYSLDATTGRQLWRSDKLGGAIVGTPAVDPAGVLFVGTFGKELIALDTSNGKVLWRYGTDGWVWASPVLANGVLYFGDLSGYLYALNAADGTLSWRIQPQNGIVSSPVVQEDKIYLTTEGDSLFIVTTAGDIVSPTVIGGAIYAAPIISGDTILVPPTSIESLLVALNMDGIQKWTFAPAKK